MVSGNIDEEPSSVTGRKDSLSINLEFVKVSLSRIRRSGGATFFETLSASKSANKMETTLINISGIYQSYHLNSVQHRKYCITCEK